MTQITVAALQLALGSFDEAENIAAVSALVEQAAGQGAQIVLPPELFSGPYFCKTEEEELFALARPVRADLLQCAVEPWRLLHDEQTGQSPFHR